MTTIEELEKEASAAQEKARKASEALERARDREAEARREPLRMLVERAHNCLCAYNHTDGCGWGYENSWNGWSHNRWLSHYDQLINGDRHNKPKVTLKEVETIISMVEELKPKVKSAMFLLRQGLVP